MSSSNVNVIPENPTSLMLAVLLRRTELVRLYIGNGVDIDTQAENGATALHLAAATGNFDAVNLLLRNQANTSLKLHSGETASDLAKLSGNEEVANLFHQHLVLHNSPRLFKPVIQAQTKPQQQSPDTPSDDIPIRIKPVTT